MSRTLAAGVTWLDGALLEREAGMVPGHAMMLFGCGAVAVAAVQTAGVVKTVLNGLGWWDEKVDDGGRLTRGRWG